MPGRLLSALVVRGGDHGRRTNPLRRVAGGTEAFVKSTTRAHAHDTKSSIDPDQKILARGVARRLDVSVRTLDRWLEQPHMEFPKPALRTYDRTGRVANRYWLLRDIVEWERMQAAKHADAA
jgi:hypothetical protein